MEAIKEILINQPHRKAVWFNSKGEWQFSPGGEFTDHKTREEILGEEKKVEVKVEETKKQKAKQKNKS